MSDSPLILDITEATLPVGFPESCPRELPIRPGQHFAEWDVCEERMSAGWREAFVEYLKSISERWTDEMERRPIGIFKDTIPAGARIIEPASGRVVAEALVNGWLICAKDDPA